jgi:hypothetical protein
MNTQVAMNKQLVPFSIPFMPGLIAGRMAASLVLLVIALATPSSALAANRWWDGATIVDPGDGIGAGGSANWGNTNKVWDQGFGLDHTNWVNGANDTAIFEGAPGTVSITHGAGVTVSALIFQTDGYTLNGNNVNCAPLRSRPMSMYRQMRRPLSTRALRIVAPALKPSKWVAMEHWF